MMQVNGALAIIASLMRQAKLRSVTYAHEHLAGIDVASVEIKNDDAAESVTITLIDQKPPVALQPAADPFEALPIEQQNAIDQFGVMLLTLERIELDHGQRYWLRDDLATVLNETIVAGLMRMGLLVHATELAPERLVMPAHVRAGFYHTMGQRRGFAN